MNSGAAAAKPAPSGQGAEREPWWEGRQVAIRPDVPGNDLDPDDLVLIESDEERLEADVAIDHAVAATKKSDELWPTWLAERPRSG
jgi:hypothetical protein